MYIVIGKDMSYGPLQTASASVFYYLQPFPSMFWGGLWYSVKTYNHIPHI